VTTGFDHKRLALLLAVLEKRAGIAFGQLDVFLNVVGGLRIAETGGDAAVAAALVSSVLDRAVPPGAVIVGELGLGGELRAVGPANGGCAKAIPGDSRGTGSSPGNSAVSRPSKGFERRGRPPTGGSTSSARVAR
jgi:hypothetical protein